MLGVGLVAEVQCTFTPRVTTAVAGAECSSLCEPTKLAPYKFQ